MDQFKIIFKVMLLASVSLSLSGCLEDLIGGDNLGSVNVPAGLSPVTDDDYLQSSGFNEGKVQLGKLLFHDKILSGNKNISCSTCHDSSTGTSDSLSLSLGEGAEGIGLSRNFPVDNVEQEARVGRNSPSLFNLGARQVTAMFHDGRVSVDSSHPKGFDTPVGDDLPDGLDNILAAQALFPLTSAIEMAGDDSENDIGVAAASGQFSGETGVWQLLTNRIQSIGEYVEMFVEAFDYVSSANDIAITHVVNAIAAYEAKTFRSDNSPFDKFLKGDTSAMSSEALNGMTTFLVEQIVFNVIVENFKRIIGFAQLVCRKLVRD